MCVLMYARAHEFTQRNGSKERKKKRKKKKGDTTVLIDRARFATRRDLIVCPDEILRMSKLSRYRASFHMMSSIFTADIANDAR